MHPSRPLSRGLSAQEQWPIGVGVVPATRNRDKGKVIPWVIHIYGYFLASLMHEPHNNVVIFNNQHNYQLLFIRGYLMNPAIRVEVPLSKIVHIPGLIKGKHIYTIAMLN